MNAPAQATPAALRPSLFAAPGRGPSGPADAQRLLTSLLPPPPARRWAPRWPWLAVGAATLAVGAGWAVRGLPDGGADGRQTAHQTARPVPAPALQPPLPAASAAVPVVAAAPLVATASQAARIEVEPARAPTRDPFLQLSPAPAAAPAASAQPARVAALPATPKAKRTPEVAAVSPAPVAAPARPAAGTSTTKAGDSDVDLIEAVMARVTGPSAAGSKPAGKAAAPDKAVPKAKPGKPGKTAKAAAGEGREPAHAKPPSLAEQVQQCRATGGLDSLLCRNRVCEGHWGADAACPVNQPLNNQP